MTIPRGELENALRSKLRAAYENEARWMDLCPEFCADSDRMEQWASTAKLRRLEVERVEALLAEMAETTERAS
jgi:hypothetical protein